MVDPAASFLSTTGTTPRQRDHSSNTGAAQFSYALAAASLEKQASQSLKVHGAAPSGEVGATPKSGDANKRAPLSDRAASSSEPSETEAPPTDRAANTKFIAAAQQAAAPSAAVSSSPPITPVLATSAAPVAAAVVKVADAPALRDALADKGRAALEKTLRASPEPATLKAEFAEILARRLEKTSIFELRLDPPEMGRVEGRLSIDDNGKSVLSLTFDNQSAFDLYSRDEQALRQALQQSGLDFATGDFVFSFKEQAPLAVPASAAFAAPVEAPSLYEPVFNASWSAGALDIRI